ncbi:MAG: S41 family peptidase [Bacteroidales bacterium]|nr:S41 family peptidase [Bacteroidales bacterium]
MKFVAGTPDELYDKLVGLGSSGFAMKLGGHCAPTSNEPYRFIGKQAGIWTSSAADKNSNHIVFFGNTLGCRVMKGNTNLNHFDSISQFKNVIVDISYNEGGDGGATMYPLQLLLDQDTILYYREETKTNNSVMKARATIKLHYYEPEDVPQDFKDNYYPYYYNEHFERDTFLGKSFPNRVEDSLRYKGNVHLIVSEQTPSAAEGFTLLLSQGKKVKTYGKKTVGAFGQPLVVSLNSGIKILINTTRSFDFEGNYITQGYTPVYDFDFSEILKISDNNEKLLKLIQVIESFE